MVTYSYQHGSVFILEKLEGNMAKESKIKSAKKVKKAKKPRMSGC